VTTVDALERRPSGKRLAIESRLACPDTGRRGAGVA
jgi:hypothetical protein